jgi:hypothetical protein
MKSLAPLAPLSAALLTVLALGSGCAAARRPLSVAMAPMAAPSAAAPAAPLREAHFDADRTRKIDEADLTKIFDAPVYLEAGARVGVVRVLDRYDASEAVPVEQALAVLEDRVTGIGAFEGVTEMSTDWPMSAGLAGLRELAARYRSEYLLLYRHRFVEERYTNGWGWLHATLVGGLFAPTRTLRTAGVLEATLFDVRSGTILFTVFERVHGEDTATMWQNDRKMERMQSKLGADAARALADRVAEKLRPLVAARSQHAPAVHAAALEGPSS